MAEGPPSKLMKRFARFGNRAIWSLDPDGFYEDPGFEGAEFVNEEKLLRLPEKCPGPSTAGSCACCWSDLVSGGSLFSEFICGAFLSWEDAERWMLGG